MAASAAIVVAGPADAATGCGGSAYAPPFSMQLGSWGPEAPANSGVAGISDTYVHYEWEAGGNVSRQVAVQGLAFIDGEATWVDIGFPGTSDDAYLPWGSVLATPKIRASSNGPGSFVSFTCTAVSLFPTD